MRHVRVLYRAFEAVNAVAFFDREVRDAMEAIGLRGYWMGYFAGRAAPMGAVTAATVEATFPSFTPRRIRRAVPAAWDHATPMEVLAARDAALRTIVEATWADVDGAVVTAVAEQCRGFLSGLDVPGARASLPLFAAHAARPWPDDPRMAIMHTAAVAREYRGDLHLALLATEGLDGVMANLLAAATPAYDAQWVRTSRGWDDAQWEAGLASLVDRGLLTSDGAFTPDGRAYRSGLEERTDQLCATPVVAFGADAARSLAADLAPFVAANVARLPASAPQAGGAGG